MCVTMSLCMLLVSLAGGALSALPPPPLLRPATGE